MNNRELSCEKRLPNELQERIADLEKLWNLYCADPEASDSDLGHISEYGLCFDYVAPNTFNDQPEGYFRYQLSWGGPSDEFRYFVNPDYSIHRIEYWFLDWFDGACQTLTGSEYDLLMEIFTMYKEAGIVESEFTKARC